MDEKINYLNQLINSIIKIPLNKKNLLLKIIIKKINKKQHVKIPVMFTARNFPIYFLKLKFFIGY